MFFQCRVGHTYGLTDVLISKEEAIEVRLWRALYALEELADLLDDLEPAYPPQLRPDVRRRRSTTARRDRRQRRRGAVADRADTARARLTAMTVPEGIAAACCERPSISTKRNPGRSCWRRTCASSSSGIKHELSRAAELLSRVDPSSNELLTRRWIGGCPHGTLSRVVTPVPC
jgi:hypothetical protein